MIGGKHVEIMVDIKQFNSKISSQNFSDLLSIACEYATDLGDIYRSKFVSEFEITDFGNIIKGEAFFHDFFKGENNPYIIIGIELKVRKKYKIEKDIIENHSWGLYPIYLGKHHICAPVTFQESYWETYGANSYSNGCGDEVQVIEVVIGRDDVEQCLKDYDFQKYSKK